MPLAIWSGIVSATCYLRTAPNPFPLHSLDPGNV